MTPVFTAPDESIFAQNCCVGHATLSDGNLSVDRIGNWSEHLCQMGVDNCFTWHAICTLRYLRSPRACGWMGMETVKGVQRKEKLGIEQAEWSIKQVYARHDTLTDDICTRRCPHRNSLTISHTANILWCRKVHLPCDLRKHCTRK